MITVKWYVKPIYVMFALALVLAMGMMAVPMAGTVEAQPASPPAPAMEQVLPEGVITGDTWNVLKGTVDFVYDFHDPDGDLYDIDLMIYGPTPYNTKETCVDVEFQAVDPPTGSWDAADWALANMMGITSVTYSEAEEKWTITVNLDKKLGAGEPNPWGLSIGDPIWPAGRWNFYFEVRDQVAKTNEDLSGPDAPTVIAHRWGYLNHPPDYACYVYSFHSIQTAIDFTIADDTINVAAGTYDGGITIDKSLTIIGAGKDQTIIDTSDSPVITISADDVIIKDLEITDSPELVEGIQVVSPASSGLTVDNVAFTGIGNAGSNAYGIRFMTSFTGLTVRDSDFTAVDHNSYYRDIGIFAGNSLTLNDFEVTGSTFEKLFTGIYLRSAIDGLTLGGNTFGPFQLSEGAACVAGIYIGDGDDYNFDIENIVITGNTFTEYGRGVYVWNYAIDETVSDVEIYENTFSNSIWSSAIRFIGGNGDNENVAFNGINVRDNIFTQYSDVGAHVSLIDFRAYCKLQSCQIDVTANEITFSGGPYTDPMSGSVFLAYEGPFTNTVIKNNTLNGGTAGGTATPPSSGILVKHESGTYWPSDTLEMDIVGNEITGFDHGISIYDGVNDEYGGLPAGSMFNVNFNNIYGNALYGVRNDNAETVDATNNWWGAGDGPSGVGPGSGDAVSDNVDYDPWLGAEPIEIKSETISGSGTMTDTAIGGQVTINGEGDHTITTAKYIENPGGTSPFMNEGSYYDFHLDSAVNVTSLTVQFCPALEGEVIYCWDGASWVEASNQVYSGGCIVVTITDETMPSLSDLTRTPFGQGFMPPVGGEAYPVNEAGLVLPWIGLGIAAIAGGSLFMIRRRRASS